MLSRDQALTLFSNFSRLPRGDCRGDNGSEFAERGEVKVIGFSEVY